MGTPIDPPYSDEKCSYSCNVCWGPGKRLGLVPPKYVYASVEGMEKGYLWHSGLPGPPNGVHELECHHSCYWRKRNDFGFTWQPNDSGDSSSFFILYGSFIEFRQLHDGAQCRTFFGHNGNECPHRIYCGGSVLVTFVDPDLVRMVALDYAFANLQGALSEHYHTDPGLLVLKFCNKKDHTNIKILVDESELPP